MRCSELSADRAAAICDGSSDKVVEMCMRFAGFDKVVHRLQYPLKSVIVFQII